MKTVSRVVIPSAFGTRDWYHGRYWFGTRDWFFYEWGGDRGTFGNDQMHYIYYALYNNNNNDISTL